MWCFLFGRFSRRNKTTTSVWRNSPHITVLAGSKKTLWSLPEEWDTMYFAHIHQVGTRWMYYNKKSRIPSDSQRTQNEIVTKYKKNWNGKGALTTFGFFRNPLKKILILLPFWILIICHLKSIWSFSIAKMAVPYMDCLKAYVIWVMCTPQLLFWKPTFWALIYTKKLPVLESPVYVLKPFVNSDLR